MEESEGASHGLLFLPGRSVHSRQAQKVYPSIFPPPASVLLCSGLGEGKAANKFRIEMKRKLGHHAGISRVVRKGNKVIIFVLKLRRCLEIHLPDIPTLYYHQEMFGISYGWTLV
jgi:hypothetical protein